MTTIQKISAILLMSMLLVACGGGGGGEQVQNEPLQFIIGGSVSGLEVGKMLVLQNNGGDDLTITSNGVFKFQSPLSNGDSYEVSIRTSPLGENCRLLGGLGPGLILGADITDISIWCSRLDFTFGGGYVRTYIGSSIYDDIAEAVAIQSDGKILIGGYTADVTDYDFALVRYKPDGYLDDALGGTGKVVTPAGDSRDFAHDIALQSDGKIILAGSSWNGYKDLFTLVRYLSNGSIDTTFGTNGVSITLWNFNGTDKIHAIAIQPDNKILAVGTANSKIAIVRYNANGSLDTTFGGTGIIESTVYSELNVASSVAIQPDGKILVGGYTATGALEHDFLLMRFTANGSLDTTFNQTGLVTTDIGGDMYSFVLDVALQPDGKILAAGYSNKDFALARYNPDGSLDTSFNGSGTVKTAIGDSDDVAYSVAIQADGKIILGGYSWIRASLGNDFALARYNIDGSLDESFGGGKLTYDLSSGGHDSIKDIAILNNGKIIAVGYSEFNNARHIAAAVYLP